MKDIEPQLDSELLEIVDLESRGYRTTALQRLKKYLRQNPNSAEGWYYAARFGNQPRQQFKSVSRALRLKPTYPAAQEFRAALLEEFPWLTPRFFTPEVRFVLLLALTLTLLSILAAAGITWFVQEREPEVIIIVPTEEPTLPPAPTNTTEIIIVTSTATPQPVTPSATFLPISTDTAEPTVEANFIEASPQPTSSPTITPTPAPITPDENALLVIAPDDLITPLTNTFTGGDILFQAASSPVTNSEEAQALATQNNAVLVIYSTGDQVNLYVNEDPASAPNHLDLIRLVRPSSTWELTLEGSTERVNEAPALQAVIAYLTYRHERVVTVLEPLFANPRTLDATEQQLALLLAYSYQAVGNHADALPLYELLNSYTAQPDPAIRLNRAYAIAETENYQSGIAMYQSLLSDGANAAFIQSNIGAIYAEHPEEENAARLAFEEAMRLDPTAARPYLERGKLLFSQGDSNGALADLDTAISVDAAYAPAYAQRADYRAQMGRLDEALDDITRAIEIQPRVGSYYMLQGDILIKLDRSQAATAAFERALRLDARSPQLHTDLAAAYFEAGAYNEAIQESNAALAIDQSFSAAWLQRGQAYLAQNELGTALNDFNQGLQRDPQNIPLLLARCTVHAQLGDDGAAATDCDSVLALDPQNGLALEQRGMIRARAGDRAGAAADFAEALTYEPTAYEAHYYLGLYALQEQRYDAAISSLSTAITLKPEIGKAYGARGVAYRITEQWQQAMTDLEQALAFAPEDTYSYYELGLVKRGLADIAYEGNNREVAEALYLEAESAFTSFIELSEPGNQFLAQAQQGLTYVQQALTVVRGQ